MQGPEEFCRKIDVKLRESVVSTLVVIFASACAAAVLMYIFAPIDDFMVDMVRDGKCTTGSSDFLMTMVQNGDNGGFIVMDSQLSDGVFTAVICGENKTSEDMILAPRDFTVYATNIANGGQPHLCTVCMTEDVVIAANSAIKFSISAIVPEGFTYENCKFSGVIIADDDFERYGLMLN
ncbi:MAG: hypothetical protein ACI4RH_05775 [Huintestinicola sp.]